GYGGKTDAVNITIENADNLSFDQLKTFGQTITALPPYQAHYDWIWLGKTLESSLQAYADTIYKLRNSWRGASSEAAADAVTKYKNGTVDLVLATKTMGDSLLYTSQWLTVTKNNMPGPNEKQKP